jgi:hypothetical protein
LISSVLVEGVALATYTYTPQNQVATVTYAGGSVDVSLREPGFPST